MAAVLAELRRQEALVETLAALEQRLAVIESRADVKAGQTALTKGSSDLSSQLAERRAARFHDSPERQAP